MKKNFALSLVCASILMTPCFANELYNLPSVVITGNGSKVSSKTSESSPLEEGFLQKSVMVGAFGDLKTSNVPYQINSISKKLIEDQQAIGLEDIIKYTPSAQIEMRGGAEVGRPQTRGFRSDVVSNTFYDGLQVFAVTAKPMEQFESVEILNGVAGTLYGPQTPSGIFNFVEKRPTATFYNSITSTYMNDGNAGVHGDFGGRDGILGYRINLVKQGGEGYVNNSTLERELVAIALDWHVSDNAVIETNFSHYDYKKEGYAGSFVMPVLTGGIARYTLPTPVDSSKAGLGQEYAGMDLETTTASTKLKYSINPDWYFEGGYLYQRSDRSIYGVSNTFTNNIGGYQAVQTTLSAPGRTDINSWMAHINTERVDPFGFQHDIAFGGNGYQLTGYSNLVTSSSSAILGNSNIYKPLVFAEPSTFNSNVTRYKSSLSDVNNLVLGDTISFNKQWQTVLTVSNSWLNQYSYSSSGAKTKTYDDQGKSYAASVIYKPVDNLSFYTTYADSILAGSSGTNADGSTTVLDPSRSKQYEIGAKTTLYNIDYSTALFQISRPIAYQGDDGNYAEKGEQRNRGVEIMAGGKLTDNLSVLGGATYLNAELQDAMLKSLNGKQIIGVPEWQYNILFDYLLPINTGTLGFSANFHYTDDRPIDEANSQYVSDYYTIDLGARYITKHFLGDKTTFRLTVNNITNEKYWAGVFAAGSMDGFGTSSPRGSQIFLGEPRRIIASMQITF